MVKLHLHIRCAWHCVVACGTSCNCAQLVIFENRLCGIAWWRCEMLLVQTKFRCALLFGIVADLHICIAALSFRFTRVGICNIY